MIYGTVNSQMPGNRDNNKDKLNKNELMVKGTINSQKQRQQEEIDFQRDCQITNARQEGQQQGQSRTCW